jgi:hypothetical protein
LIFDGFDTCHCRQAGSLFHVYYSIFTYLV